MPLQSPLQLTRVCFQVLGSHHDHKSDRPLVSEHLVGPAADGPHAFHCCDAVICYQDLSTPETGKEQSLHSTEHSTIMKTVFLCRLSGFGALWVRQPASNSAGTFNGPSANSETSSCSTIKILMYYALLGLKSKGHMRTGVTSG